MRVFDSGYGIIVLVTVCDTGLVGHPRGIGIVTARQSARTRRVTKARGQLSRATVATNMGYDILVATCVRPTGRKAIVVGYN